MGDENSNDRERLPRRSSILRLPGGGDGDELGTGQRRVSFASNMKLKTFDDTGLNTSELVPQPADNSDMSLVSSGTVTENISMETEISQEQQGPNGVEQKSMHHIVKVQQTVSFHATVVKKTNGAKAVVDSSDSEDSDGENLTGDILSQQACKTIPADGEMELETSDANGELTGDFLREMSQPTVLENTSTNGTFARDEPEKAAANAAEPDESTNGQMSDDVRKMYEAWRAKDQQIDAQIKSVKQLYTNLNKQISDYTAELKNRPIYAYKRNLKK